MRVGARLHALLTCAALAVAAALPVQAEARPAGPAGQVGKRLRVAGYSQVKVRCSKPRRARAASLSSRCRWRGRRRASGGRSRLCTGRYSAARRRGGRWRLRYRGRRCRAAPRRPGQPGAGPPPRPGGPPIVPPPARRPLFGFNDNAVRAGLLEPERDSELTAQAGADISRVTFDWRWVEPQPGDLRLSAYDHIYRELRGRGIRPVLILMFAPWWTWELDVICNQWAQDCRYPPGRAHDEDWRRIARLLATRYPEAAGIEIWNEPNIPTFWRPEPDVGRYTELLKEAYTAVKQVNPDMRVISGGLANEDWDAKDGAVYMRTFAQGIYQHGGKEFMDALGFHTYPGGLFLGPGSTIERSFNRIRGVRDAFGDSAKPLWVTESGLSVTDPSIPVDEAEQAQGLAAVYRKLAAMPDVEAIVFHTLLASQSGANNPGSGYGVLRPDITPRPAFCAIARERKSAYRCP